jgi:hypothetical protein
MQSYHSHMLFDNTQTKHEIQHQEGKACDYHWDPDPDPITSEPCVQVRSMRSRPDPSQ